MPFDLQTWTSEMEDLGNVLFSIKGEISDQQIIDSLDVIETKIETQSGKIKKKVYNVLVECMQNLFHHSKELPSKSGYDIIGKYVICLLIKTDKGFKIISGNFVDNKQHTFLTKHLEHINTLDNLGLKELYKSILNNQEFSEKGGGGLGLVDICRKSGNKLDYNFYDYKDEYRFFSLQINIYE